MTGRQTWDPDGKKAGTVPYLQGVLPGNRLLARSKSECLPPASERPCLPTDQRTPSPSSSHLVGCIKTGAEPPGLGLQHYCPCGSDGIVLLVGESGVTSGKTFDPLEIRV